MTDIKSWKFTNWKSLDDDNLYMYIYGSGAKIHKIKKYSMCKMPHVFFLLKKPLLFFTLAVCRRVWRVLVVPCRWRARALTCRMTAQSRPCPWTWCRCALPPVSAGRAPWLSSSCGPSPPSLGSETTRFTSDKVLIFISIFKFPVGFFTTQTSSK